MITITLNEESGITVGELSVFPSKTQITGFVDVKTNGISWYFSSIWKYGNAEEFKNEKAVKFDNLPFGLDRFILNEQGQENYPTTDGGYTDYRVMIYRACDMYKQVLEQEYPNLSGQIEVTGMPK
jgi:hypothetical protein